MAEVKQNIKLPKESLEKQPKRLTLVLRTLRLMVFSKIFWKSMVNELSKPHQP